MSLAKKDLETQDRFTAGDARKMGFIPVPLGVLRDHGPCAQTIGALLSIFRQDGKTTFRRQDILAKNAGVPLRTFRRHLASLEAAGQLIRKKRRRDRQSDVLQLGQPEADLLAAGFLPLPRYALGLSFSQRIVYAWIIYRAEVSPLGNSCTDTLATIAGAVGLSRRAIGLAIKALVEKNFITRTEDLSGDTAECILQPPFQGGEEMAERLPGGCADMAERPSEGCADMASRPRKNGLKVCANVAGPIKENLKEPDKKKRLVLDGLLAEEGEAIATELSRLRGKTWPALKSLGLDGAGVIACLIARHRRQLSAPLADYAVGLLVRMAEDPKTNPIGWTISELRDFSPEAAGQVQKLLPTAKRVVASLVAKAESLRVRVPCGICNRDHEPGLRDLLARPVCSTGCKKEADTQIETRRQDRLCGAEPLAVPVSRAKTPERKPIPTPTKNIDISPSEINRRKAELLRRLAELK